MAGPLRGSAGRAAHRWWCSSRPRSARAAPRSPRPLRADQGRPGPPSGRRTWPARRPARRAGPHSPAAPSPAAQRESGQFLLMPPHILLRCIARDEHISSPSMRSSSPHRGSASARAGPALSAEQARWSSPAPRAPAIAGWCNARTGTAPRSVHAVHRPDRKSASITRLAHLRPPVARRRAGGPSAWPHRSGPGSTPRHVTGPLPRRPGPAGPSGWRRPQRDGRHCHSA
jgi:hypothetical protein